MSIILTNDYIFLPPLHLGYLGLPQNSLEYLIEYLLIKTVPHFGQEGAADDEFELFLLDELFFPLP